MFSSGVVRGYVRRASAAGGILSMRGVGLCRKLPSLGSPFPSWRYAMVFLTPCCFTGGGAWPRAQAEVRALDKRVREPERVLGKKTLEHETPREAVKVADEKELISRLPSLPREGSP
jgi:hypothetical protein